MPKNKYLYIAKAKQIKQFYACLYVIATIATNIYHKYLCTRNVKKMLICLNSQILGAIYVINQLRREKPSF